MKTISFWDIAFISIIVSLCYWFIVDITANIWLSNWLHYQKKLLKYKMELEEMKKNGQGEE